jgi:2-methylfumaryl-CoA isomerase
MHRDAITEVLRPWFAQRSSAEIGTLFDDNSLTWSVFRDFESALAQDPDLSTDNPIFSDIETPGLGKFLVPGSPLNFSQFEREEPVPTPTLGMHTEEILGDVVGLPDVEIAQLFDSGTVQSPNYAKARPAA